MRVPWLELILGQHPLDVPQLPTRSMMEAPILWRATPCGLLPVLPTNKVGPAPRSTVRGEPLPLQRSWIMGKQSAQLPQYADPLMRTALVKPKPPKRKGRVANSRTATEH